MISGRVLGHHADRKKRLAIVAHWDPRGKAASHFLSQLDQLNRSFDRVIVASPSPLDADAEESIRRRADLIRRENFGHDFGSWYDGLATVNWGEEFDEILLTNDSYVGFFRPLEQILNEMAARPFDVWGITKTWRHAEHIQSYFLYFTAPVVRSRAFRNFWMDFKPAANRSSAIKDHEVGISTAMIRAGFRLGAFLEPTRSERLTANRRGAHWLTRRMVDFPGVFTTKESFKIDALDDPDNANMLNWSTAFADLTLDDARLPVLKFDTIRYDPYWLDSNSLLVAVESRYPEHMSTVREFLSETDPYYGPRANENYGSAELSPIERLSAYPYPALAETRAEESSGDAYISARVQREMDVLIASGVVDPVFYAAQLGVESTSEQAAAEHYVREGESLGFAINPLIDASFLKKRFTTPGRTVVGSWIDSRQWMVRTNRFWRPSDYLGAFPAAADHPGGPVGHLTELVMADPGSVIVFQAAGGRRVRWDRVYPALLEVARDAAERNRSRFARGLREELRHESSSAKTWNPSMPSPLVSIVLPVRNRPSALRAAVDSVLSQTWSDWELLIVDDGSSDDTLVVEEILEGIDDRIRVLRRQHGGVCKARNAALDAARGDWVAFLDSDNTWFPNFLGDMVTSLTSDTGVPIAQAGYATTEVHNSHGVRYREGAPAWTDLIAGNSIDLNVLVARRDLLQSIGGFDESLRRAVDYDLVLRIAERAEIAHVPILGTSYSDDVAQPDRISTSEPFGWNTVVRLRHLPSEQSQSPRPGTSLLAVLQGGLSDSSLGHFLRKLRELGSRADTQVIVAAVGCSRDERSALALVAAVRQNVRVVPFEANESFAFVVNRALPLVERDVLVVIDPRAGFTPEGAFALAETVRSSRNAVVMPVAQAANWSIHSAGASLVGPKRIPAPILPGHPLGDVASLPALIEIPLLDERSFAISTTRLREVGGLDPILTNEFSLEALSLALRRSDPDVRLVLATHVVWRHTEPERAFRMRDHEATRSAFSVLARGAAVMDVNDVYSQIGLEVAGWQTFPLADARHDVPIVTRRLRSVEVAGEQFPRLRWSLKTSAPAGAVGETWGDTHFARSLAKALESLGQHVIVDSRERAHPYNEHLDDVVIVLRGLDHYVPNRGALSYMWLISHPDLVTRREAATYDRVFAASEAWARTMGNQWNLSIEPLLQCTDAHLFHPQEGGRGDDTVFVGTSRNVPRPVVMSAVRAGVPLRLYGSGWEKFLPEFPIAAPYVPNHELPALYGTAGVVLNDHWADMAREGFISNRLFDVVAAGGRVISDYVEGIEDIFGEAVQTYASPAELQTLLTTAPARLFPDDHAITAISDRVREQHSFESRARVLLDRALTDLGHR